METQKYLLIESKTIVSQKDTYRATCLECRVAFVDKVEYEEKKKLFNSMDDVDMIFETYRNVETYSYDEYIPEVEEKDKYVCVYAENDEGVGEDPYFWDYEQVCFEHCDGSNWNTICSDKEYTVELELIDTIEKRESDFNWGRAVYYYIFKDEKECFVVGFENEGYYHPIEKVEEFETETEAREYVEKILQDA